MILLRSRQFWVAVLALIQTLMLNYLGVPAELWLSTTSFLFGFFQLFRLDNGAQLRATVPKGGSK